MNPKTLANKTIDFVRNKNKSGVLKIAYCILKILTFGKILLILGLIFSAQAFNRDSQPQGG
ncbi:hypothetical protein [Pantoea agglomerans]|uniref:hypothetical protein n=1 Tax=Enterobacter agglomerans TaxID=549 RepID=UPI00320B5809